MSLKKFIALMLTVLLVIGVVLAGGYTAGKTTTLETPAQIVKDITPQQAFTLIQENKNKPDFVIIDVRKPEEFADGHIANAVNIDFYSATFRNGIDRLDKSQTYLVYCRSGARSLSSAKIMEELGFKEVYNMSGGIIGWKAAEMPTVK